MIGIEWRRVPCSHSPAQAAPEGSTPMPHFELPQALGFKGARLACSGRDGGCWAAVGKCRPC